MGFEIVYKFSDIVDGKCVDEIKEKKVMVGKADQSISLETVAGKIIAQLARRSIFLVDVEIYEFTRKKVNYKQDEEFIKIKGRKFNFDDGVIAGENEAGEDEAGENDNTKEQLLKILLDNPDLISNLTTNPKVAPKVIPKAVTTMTPAPKSDNSSIIKSKNSPIRWEVFDPVDEKMVDVAKDNKWVFTKGKRYPVYEEQPASTNPMHGMAYVTVDDTGKRRLVNDKYFVTSTSPLLGEGEFMEDSVSYLGDTGLEPTLSYGENAGDMPALRR